MIKITVGRRIPRAWAKRLYSKMTNLMTFQQNLWIIVNGAFSRVSKDINKANKNGKTQLSCNKKNLTKKDEDIHYFYEYTIYEIESPILAEELEEFKDLEALDNTLSKAWTKNKKKFYGSNQVPDHLKKGFSKKQFEKLGERGVKDSGGLTVRQRLLEAGIIITYEHISI